MNILHTSEYYSPFHGGAVEVVKKISEHLVKQGHKVTIATTKRSDRQSSNINGVHVEEFAITGHVIRGYSGETARYQQFLLDNQFDLVMNYAAEVWTTDLTFPLLNRFSGKKVMIPCGFSHLFVPQYAFYYVTMPQSMQQYDHLVFHSGDYHDTNFARKHGFTHFSIIPNGASEVEFEQPDLTFRERYNIPQDVPLLLTVGTHTGVKGHNLVLKAFQLARLDKAVLIIIGNTTGDKGWWETFGYRTLNAIQKGRITQAGKNVLRAMLGGFGAGCLPDCRMRTRWINLTNNGQKRVILMNPHRHDVVAALHAADLFVFGSNIEYSPVVLFEAMASKTAFVTTKCGNAEEIVAWGNGGIIVPTAKGSNGKVYAEPQIFARVVEELVFDTAKRQQLAEAGHQAWRERFTWEKIVEQYEQLYQSLVNH